MRFRTAALLIGALVEASSAWAAARPFSITRSDPALDAIIAPGAQLELLADRFGITEGPAWVRDGRDGFLLVSDLTANVIYKIASDHRVSVFLDKAGYGGTDFENAGIQSRSGRMYVLLIGPSCASFDSSGRLLWCADNDGAIMRLEKDGTRTVVAGGFEGKRFNGPNDLVQLHDGSLYFTDPDFGLRYGAKSPQKQLDSAGVWYVKDGRPRKVLDAAELGGPPDGIALSPDERFLYLTAGLGVMKRYEIGADRGLSNGQVFARSPAIGDGLRTDLAGDIFTASGAGPGTVGIFSPAGKLLGTINLPVPDEEPRRQICASNVAFGGSDGKELFITACQAVYQIHLRSAGPVAGARSH
jgi:gluconolactonase